MRNIAYALPLMTVHGSWYQTHSWHSKHKFCLSSSRFYFDLKKTSDCQHRDLCINRHNLISVYAETVVDQLFLLFVSWKTALSFDFSAKQWRGGTYYIVMYMITCRFINNKQHTFESKIEIGALLAAVTYAFAKNVLSSQSFIFLSFPNNRQCSSCMVGKRSIRYFW